jgi:hypothetical protein
MGLHKTHTRWLVRSWNIFCAKTNHGQHTHKSHHGLNLGEATTFPLIIYSTPLHRAHIQMAFLSRDSRMGVSKLHQLGLLQLWSPITLWADLKSRCSLKQSCSSCWELSNNMLQVIYKQVNQVDSWLFLVGSQTGSLTPGLSFGYNLCFRCPNEQCKPILNIYWRTPKSRVEPTWGFNDV